MRTCEHFDVVVVFKSAFCPLCRAEKDLEKEKDKTKELRLEIDSLNSRIDDLEPEVKQ